MECHLALTALSGAVVNISMSVAKFDRFEDLEDHVVDYLASVTDLKVFGCTIDFLQDDTQTYLENPIWEKLQQSTEYTMVFRSCCEVLPTKEIFEGCPFRDIPLAVHVPMNPEEMVPEGAFAAHWMGVCVVLLVWFCVWGLVGVFVCCFLFSFGLSPLQYAVFPILLR